MKIGRWSTTAGNNNSTPPDGFPESQATAGFNDGMREVMAAVKTALQDIDFVDHALTPTYVNANSFTVAGDQTARLNANRQLKLFTGSTVYRSIQTASFTAVTTVQLNSGSAITANLSSFAVGIINPTHLAPLASAYVTFYYIADSSILSVGQSHNVASVSMSGTASFRITFTTALGTADYTANIYIPYESTGVGYIKSYSATTSICTFTIGNVNGVGQPLTTAAEVNCVFHGG